MVTYSFQKQLRYHIVLNPKIVFPTVDLKYKMGCICPMVILFEFTTGQYWADDHQKDAPHFRRKWTMLYDLFISHLKWYFLLKYRNTIILELFYSVNINQIVLLFKLVRCWRTSLFILMRWGYPIIKQYNKNMILVNFKRWKMLLPK